MMVGRRKFPAQQSLDWRRTPWNPVKFRHAASILAKPQQYLAIHLNNDYLMSGFHTHFIFV
jgi:hypothetical protein